MIPGSGYRLVADVAMEISLHLVQPVVYTTTATLINPGPQTVTVGSLGIPTNACYIGAQLLVQDSVNGTEVITLTGFNTTGPTITAVFAFTHPIGTTIYGATFPLQQATDAIFTQAEIISYIQRAENEVLSKCPVVYQVSQQTVLFNQIFQSSPANMIELNRVSLSQQALTVVALSRNGTGTVTATSPYPHGLVQGETFTVYYCAGDQSFLGVFSVASVTTAEIFTYLQDGAASTTSSASLGLFLRLYEITQEEQTMQERTWRSDTFVPPTAFFEDRAGNYRWGVNTKPQGNFPVELMYSIRDNDSLTLADGFVMIDAGIPYIKYKALEFCYSKDGMWQSPQLAKYCKMRAEKGVMILNRFFQGEQMGVSSK